MWVVHEYMTGADVDALTAALRQMGLDADLVKIWVRQAARTPVDRSAYGRVAR